MPLRRMDCLSVADGDEPVKETQRSSLWCGFFVRGTREEMETSCEIQCPYATHACPTVHPGCVTYGLRRLGISGWRDYTVIGQSVRLRHFGTARHAAFIAIIGRPRYLQPRYNDRIEFSAPFGDYPGVALESPFLHKASSD